MSRHNPSRKAIRTFALASFLNDMGSDIIYPVWPLFVTTVLKANMAALGFLDGLGEALIGTLIGVILWPATLQLVNGMAWVHAKFARVMLSMDPLG